MFVTPNMGLKAWDQETDPYSNTDLANNFVALDQHDHSPGKGAPLTLDSFPTLDQTKLGVCSVNTPQICDGAVTAAKIASPGVRGVNIYNDSIGGNHIVANAVDTSELKDRSVTEPKLADTAVSSRAMATDSVTNPKIKDGAVSPTKLATHAVTTDKLDFHAVTNEKLDDHAVITAKLDDDAVTHRKMANNSVGIAEMRRVPACYLVINQTQNVGHNDFHQIVWDANRYDTDDMWDQTGKKYLTIKTDGLYLIEACVMWEDGVAHAGVSGRRAKIRRNNTSLVGNGPITPLTDEPDDPQAPYRVRLPMSTVIGCLQGDKLDVVAEQTSGGTQKLLPDGLNTHFSVVWLGAHPGTGNNAISDHLDEDSGPYNPAKDT